MLTSRRLQSALQAGRTFNHGLGRYMCIMSNTKLEGNNEHGFALSLYPSAIPVKRHPPKSHSQRSSEVGVGCGMNQEIVRTQMGIYYVVTMNVCDGFDNLYTSSPAEPRGRHLVVFV